MRWVAGVIFLASGCALEEVGLAPGGDEGGALDATFDTSAPDVNPPDAPVDATGDATGDAALDATGDATADGALDAGIDAPVKDAGPILEIGPGTYDLLTEDGGVCSGNSGSSIQFQLTNERDASVDLIWVNYQCVEQLYAQVLGGAAPVNQQTYVNHVWRVRNTADQAFLGEFRLTQATTYTVIVH